MELSVNTVIDTAKCIGCGKCVNICLSETLSMEGGKAVVSGNQSLNCGQCQAVCPVGAITVTSLKMPSYASFTADNRWLGPAETDLPQLVRLLGSRRSGRNFKDQAIALDMLKDLCRVATTAPSGTNSQEWQFTIITAPQAIRSFGDGVTDIFAKLNRISAVTPLRKVLKNLGLKTLDQYYGRYYEMMTRLIDDWRAGRRDRLFYAAPALILISNGSEATLPVEDALLASQNLMLAAHAMGLGTCLIGFATQALKMNRGLKAKLGLSADEKVGATIALGWPTTAYTTTIARRAVETRLI